MKQNKYDDLNFFSAYKQMQRSVRGLEAAGEWHVLRGLLPELTDKDVLDLGCGFGWHCLYARQQQARTVIGVDISEKMLQKAREQTDDSAISYVRMSIEDISFERAQFDLVISSLALHYVESFAEVCQKVYEYLKPGGAFIFSVEHPLFTARAEQDWHYDDKGNRLHWPVDHYQEEGVRDTTFLTDRVIKYHRTISTYMNDVIGAGFALKAVKEPVPSDEMLKQDASMKDEWRRPMFLLIAAEKE
ncbi:methyltransferase [Brevibacillus reuszeri]|uniref:Methyltransferase n=1 Tax=Brevibacillus reuszeri TaxID=54915 RepID=A0A0K9Z282_9BACL|nr:class I SAM-dependent methyltransferase [Brevibacillus reuszeri]KNB74570.1 SAM-dependent methyltransferase [Brevibacillus reuszeri]MED1856503.1 class I SAM-dependent methyltransferase [Brevibacillus reuszeri]GED67798.1 methyltransferase [Brevibacillus reuszeri]